MGALLLVLLHDQVCMLLVPLQTVDLQKQLEEIKNQLDSQKDNSAYRQSPADQVGIYTK